MVNAILYYNECEDVSFFAGKEKLMFGNKIVLQKVAKESTESLFNNAAKYKVFYGDKASEKFKGLATERSKIKNVAKLISWAKHCKTAELKFSNSKLFSSCSGNPKSEKMEFHIVDILLYCAMNDLPVNLNGDKLELLFIHQLSPEVIFKKVPTRAILKRDMELVL